MQEVKLKKAKVTNWTETLRSMPAMSFLQCSIEEKDILAPIATNLKRKEGKVYSFKKDRETKRYTVTRKE